ncbi:MAG: phospho-N-acetylmuramoyl-pentapeptide-transferase [Chitinophagaceae bacterium]|nr:phospho-N-acetylmuramoyl-pentapeptide-transferase [Oligoflexus sp.]
MIYNLLHSIAEDAGPLNVVRYITFRAMAAMLTALGIGLFSAPWFIRWLKTFKVGQQVRNDGPQSHFSKAGTPTMGGVLILTAAIIPALLWMDWTNPHLWLVTALTIGYGALGFMDDYLKVSKKNTKGLSSKKKMLGQIVIATIVCWIHYAIYQNSELHVPFFKELIFDLGWGYVPFAVFVIVGASNAVNLTDGLDGLAIGPVMTTAGTFLILSYVGGNSKLAEYLQLHYLRETGELAIFCAAIVGAGMAFLWYNTFPAQVFMGDVGSLPLGGALGAIAVFTKNEILLVLVGAVFVVEALSVILQVGSFKLRGKRIFRMAPIHHHYELKGWPEPRVVIRFWIISVILAIIGLMSLKLR